MDRCTRCDRSILPQLFDSVAHAAHFFNTGCESLLSSSYPVCILYTNLRNVCSNTVYCLYTKRSCGSSSTHSPGSSTQLLALPRSGLRTFLELTCWVRGTNPSTLERKSAWLCNTGYQPFFVCIQVVRPPPPVRKGISCQNVVSWSITCSRDLGSYWGTSLIRNSTSLGLCSRAMPRALWWS